MRLNPRHHQLLQTVRERQPLSRRDLHLHLSLRPNTIGELVEELIDGGLICEGLPEPAGRGRPQVPLRIDLERRCAVGIAVQPNTIHVSQLDLLGNARAPAMQYNRGGKTKLQSDLTRTIEQLKKLPGEGKDITAIGITVPGLIDPDGGRITSSAASTRTSRINLSSWTTDHDDYLNEQPGIVIDNDMHAIAAQWLLTQRINAAEDTLLIYLNDGAVGAALLIDGRPNRGCVLGGNELGHMRFNVDTERCYCGHTGCLERICSSAFLHRHGDSRDLLRAANDLDAPPMTDICRYLSMGLANCINFIRPHRVHVISPLTDCSSFRDAINAQVKSQTLAALAGHVTLEWSTPPEDEFAQAAGWLALTSIYMGNWSHGTTVE